MSPSTEHPAKLSPGSEPTAPVTPALPLDMQPITDWETGVPAGSTPKPDPAPAWLRQSQRQGFRWKNLSLRTKTALAAIAITTIPIAGIGLAADYFAGQAVSAQIQSGKQARANALARRLGMFMRERFRDTQAIAQAPLLSNPALASFATKEQKEQFLTNNLKINGEIFSSIAVFDLQGNILAQNEGSDQGNIASLPAFQQVIQTEEAVITNPENISGTIAASFLVPVKDPNNKLIGVVRSIVPLKSLYNSVEDLATFGDEIHVIDASGNFIFVSEDDEKLFGQSVETEFPGFMQRLEAQPMDSKFNIDAARQQRLIAHKTQDEIPGLPAQLNWVGIVTLDGNVALKPRTDLRLTLIIGTLAAAVAVSGLAILWARRTTKPIVNAAKAVQLLGQGVLDTRLDVPESKDELAVLGSNINQMADQIQNLLKAQELAAQEQLTAQAEVAAQQLMSAQEQQEAREALQNRAMQLLMEVSPLRQGDLTVRAQVTEDEIGTIADSYNATILSLRNLVSQVQGAAGQVSGTATTSQTFVQQLSTDALTQANSIQTALARLEEMIWSIQNVAESAANAEQAVQVASATINAGDQAMNQTVSDILGLRETVAETAKKVQQLGQSSQEISKVVKLIGTFAAQTNLLALKASIEAARAGEEGRGFVVLADEVRTLAQQSAKATEEIEQLVTSIQAETQEVVQAMERGTQQVTMGSQRVEETRQTLTQIAQASQQISALVQAINEAADFQEQASKVVSATMANVAGTANSTSARANQVQVAFQDLLQVAGQLQTTVGQFKLS